MDTRLWICEDEPDGCVFATADMLFSLLVVLPVFGRARNSFV